MVLSGDNEGSLKVVMDSSELGTCAGNPQQFVNKLREKGALSSSVWASSCLAFKVATTVVWSRRQSQRSNRFFCTILTFTALVGLCVGSCFISLAHSSGRTSACHPSQPCTPRGMFSACAYMSNFVFDPEFVDKIPIQVLATVIATSLIKQAPRHALGPSPNAKPCFVPSSSDEEL